MSNLILDIPSETLCVCMSHMTIEEILRLVSSHRYSEADKACFLKSILLCMVKHIPQISIGKWYCVLGGEKIKLSHAILSDINNVYLSYVKGCVIRGHVVRDQAQIDDCFLSGWLNVHFLRERVFPLGGLCSAGYFASEIGRKFVCNYTDQKMTELVDRHKARLRTVPDGQHEYLIREFSRNKCRVEMTKTLAETSFDLVYSKISGEAWNTFDEAMGREISHAVPRTDPACRRALYVSVKETDVEDLNAAYKRNPGLPKDCFTPFDYLIIGVTDFQGVRDRVS
jgi:hypothetical protein